MKKTDTPNPRDTMTFYEYLAFCERSKAQNYGLEMAAIRCEIYDNGDAADRVNKHTMAKLIREMKVKL
jgi:hypothetical protein